MEKFSRAAFQWPYHYGRYTQNDWWMSMSHNTLALTLRFYVFARVFLCLFLCPLLRALVSCRQHRKTYCTWDADFSTVFQFHSQRIVFSIFPYRPTRKCVSLSYGLTHSLTLPYSLPASVCVSLFRFVVFFRWQNTMISIIIIQHIYLFLVFSFCAVA